MDVSRRRAGVKANVVSGSVWESRMKLNGDSGFKVFNGGDTNSEDSSNVDSPRKIIKKAPIGSKRKTWKSDTNTSFDGTIQIAKSGGIKNSDEQLLSDGIKKSLRKGKSDGGIQGKKGKSRSDVKEVVESSNNTQLREVKSVESGKDIGIDSGVGENNSILLRKSKSEPKPVITEDSVISGIDDDEKSPPQSEEISGSEESCKEFSICQEDVVSTANQTESPKKDEQNLDNDVSDCDEETDEETEMEVDIKEIKVAETKQEEDKKEEIKSLQEEKPKKIEINNTQELKKKVVLVNENKNVYQLRNRITPVSSTINKHPPPSPVLRRATIYQNLANATKPISVPAMNECQNFPERHSKLQNLVDLVMWRDISRSVFVFGIGTFIIVSSSYTNDLNVSFISVISYLGLAYLAAIFLYRSLICRGVIIDIDETKYVVGEEEAIWLLKLILPYLNECLLKIRALFSGDPATTMKLAVVLFVFARCGTSITLWKMAKLGFFGVFTVPKVCSSYSTHLTAYAKFWIRRLRDAWDSCSHKKAVALGIFTLVWNLSTTLARVWAVFMMFVAVKYYQQKMESGDWVEYEDVGDNDQTLRHGVGLGPNPVVEEVNKVKKGC